MQVLTPRSLDEALRLKAELPDARPIAGGTDLLVELNFDLPADLPPRSDFRLQLIHIIGSPQELQLVTPSTYAGPSSEKS